MSRLLQLLGAFANAIGIPGIVRDTEYRSKATGTRVLVKRGKFFTVVSVNGVDVYFNRFSGTIDGVGVTPASGSQACQHGRIQELVRSDGQLLPPPVPIQSRKTF